MEEYLKVQARGCFLSKKHSFFLLVKTKWHTTFQYMRCFAERSGAKYGRAKCNERTAYTVLCVPSRALRSESAAWSERSGEVIFLSLLFLCREISSSFKGNLIFFVFFPRGVRGELEKGKHLILLPLTPHCSLLK